VRTKPDGLGNIYRYVSLADTVLPAGAAGVAALCEAEEYGTLPNAGPGQICELVTPVAGIAGVTNAAGWLMAEGANQEADAECQRRYALSWEALGGVVSAKYKAVTLGVKGVADVAVADQHPRGEGTIDVIVKGTAGIPTEKLLEEVRAALNQHIVINHDLLVKGPTLVPVNVVFALEILTGDPAAAVLAAENYVRAVFSGSNPAIVGLGIGQDVIRDRLAVGLITLSGVKRITWGGDLAAGDITVPLEGLAVLASLAITYSWAAEA
jgi:phage-related baseplate assembly protein